MWRRRGGFTMVEMLVAVVAIAFLAGVVLPTLSHRPQSRVRSGCASNLGNIIKCCHLYSDAGPNLGQFPLFDEKHNFGGQLAMAKLYGAYIKDHRVYCCPNKTSTTSALNHYHAPDESTLQTGYTNYGYDPGHTPVHATAGVVSDRGILLAKNHGNSTNHGKDGPGQNVAIGAGSVEWMDNAQQRLTKDANDSATTDDIFSDNLNGTTFPEELETNIIP